MRRVGRREVRSVEGRVLDEAGQRGLGEGRGLGVARKPAFLCSLAGNWRVFLAEMWGRCWSPFSALTEHFSTASAPARYLTYPPT